MTKPRPTKEQLANLDAECVRVARSNAIARAVTASPLHLSNKQLGKALAVERMRSVEALKKEAPNA